VLRDEYLFNRVATLDANAGYRKVLTCHTLFNLTDFLKIFHSFGFSLQFVLTDAKVKQLV
jgi:hypothetical protein